jgi:hypothetical protein
MARRARVVVPGIPHHITQRGVRAMRIFFSLEDRLEYLWLLRYHDGIHGLHFASYTLMDNHVLWLFPNGKIACAERSARPSGFTLEASTSGWGNEATCSRDAPFPARWMRTIISRHSVMLSAILLEQGWQRSHGIICGLERDSTWGSWESIH